MKIPFNRPYATGSEFKYIAEAIEAGHLSGDGSFTKKCHQWLQDFTGAGRALLTHSCTAALEMSAILCDVGPGDEVIMPSYTFVSTANAFVLRGATPVFVDIRPDTLNLDENLLEAAITPKTRVICPVHYAGVGAEMRPILEIAKRRGLRVVEDAAQGLMSSYDDRALGSIGSLGALSFHETKNVIAGEGGALLINDPELVVRAEVIREKGTNRSAFFRGEVDKYTWVDVGSSFLPSELVAAFLWAQMQEAQSITERRLALWQRYFDAFADDEARERLRRPVIPAGRRHNAHMFYLILPSLAARARVLSQLKERGFLAVFHYVPLHSSPAGRKYGRPSGAMTVTDDLSDRLVRLPLWVGLPEEKLSEIVEVVRGALMRLGLVEGPGHHAAMMWEELEGLGHEVVMVRAHPTFVAPKHRRRDVLLHDGVRRIVAAAQHRLKLSTQWDFDVYTRLYGHLAARYVADCDAVIGFSFVAREAHRRARRSILELPATHLAVHEQIVDEEHARAGQPRRVRMSRAALERAQAEYAQADVVDVLSAYARKTLIDRGVAAEKIVVSPPGVDIQRFRPSEKRDEGFRVLCVGRVELAKGIRTLAQAQLRDLVLIGAVSDEARPFLGGCTVKPPMPIDDLAHEYRQADVLAFPTLSDGFGLVMLEAMASGIPVVASDRSGAPDVIRDGVDGFIVPAGDAAALAERLRLLQHDPAKRREMGRAARQRVESQFSRARYRERLAQLLHRAAPDGSARAPRESAARPSPR